MFPVAKLLPPQPGLATELFLFRAPLKVSMSLGIWVGTVFPVVLPSESEETY